MAWGDVLFNTTDPARWGAGVNREFTKRELDLIHWELKSQILRLAASMPMPNDVVGSERVGTNVIFHYRDGTSSDPIELPVLRWHPRGDWEPDTIYAELDWFTVAGVGIFFSLQNHQSAGAFDPDAQQNGQPLYWSMFDLINVTLDMIGGVSLTDPAENDALVYDGAQWVNRRSNSVPRVIRTPIEGQTLYAADGELGCQLVPAGQLNAINVQLPQNPRNFDTYELGTTEYIVAVNMQAVSNEVTIQGAVFPMAANSGSSWWYSEDDLTWYIRWRSV